MTPVPSDKIGEPPSSVADALAPLPESFSDASNATDWLRTVAGVDPVTGGTPVILDDARPPHTKPPKGRRPLPQIPGYEILEELGRGGMGVVFKARHLGLNRLVALKMILAGELASPESLTRFRSEAQLLAQLQHPNIVQVYDVGTIEDKSGTTRPYMALELVEGGSLSRQLRGKPQPPREVAALIIVLARAIHAAHEKGIIHRDLKPGNVLLSGNAARPSSEKGSSTVKGWGSLGNTPPHQAGSTPSTMTMLVPPPLSLLKPKITDFGLAKRLESDSSQTRTGEIVGTPNYMSPEQAAGRNQELGPAVDIYALGAILYEALTGRPPFQGISPMDTVLQVLAREPLPPSILLHELPRDLETICLKCLRREANQRYTTAAELADDLQRFLDGEPLLARPVGRTERAWRWCRRNPVLAGLSVTVVILLLAGSLISAYFAVLAGDRAKQAEQNRDDARKQQVLAEENAAKAQRNEQRAMEEEAAARLVSDFLTGLFQDSDPLAVGGRVFGAVPRRSDTLLAREVVDRGRKQLETQLKDKPKLRAMLLDKIGNVYLGLGDITKAEELLREALLLRRTLLPPDHPDLATSLQSMGFVQFLRYRRESITYFRQALEIREKQFGPDDPRVAETLIYLAMPLVRDLEHTEGEALLRRALAIRRRQPGDNRRDVVVPLCILAYSLLKRGEVTQALPYLAELAKLTEEIEYKGIGVVLRKGSQAKLAEKLNPRQAVKLWQETITEASAILGKEHFILTFLRSELIELLFKIGDPPAQEKELRIYIPLLERFYERQSHMVGNAKKNLGVSLSQQGKVAEAALVLEEAIAILRTLKDGDGRWRLAQGLAERANVAVKQGDVALAAKCLREEVTQRIYLYHHHKHSLAVVQLTYDNLEDALFFSEDMPGRWSCLLEAVPWFDLDQKLPPLRTALELLGLAETIERLHLPMNTVGLRQLAWEICGVWRQTRSENECLRYALPKLMAALAGSLARAGRLYGPDGALAALRLYQQLVDTFPYRYPPHHMARQQVQLVEHACLYAAGCQTLEQGAAAFPPSVQKHKQHWRERALELLRAARQAGYRNVHRLRTDPDFAGLRALPEFTQLLREMETEKP